MKTLDIPDEYRDRIEALRSELADEHAGAYATVDTGDVLAYLLDLADAVDDPSRTADPVEASTSSPSTAETDTTGDPGSDGRDGPEMFGTPFDREPVRERLAARNRKHGDPDGAERMDLYAMAAAFDVTGRSEMTKDELIDAIIDRATAFATDPFGAIGVEIDVDEGPAVEANGDPEGEANEADQAVDTEADSDADDTGTTQLNAMMSLLDTHDDKWREGEGDVRYEVDLPDGSVETARTKDDVRALLFKNY